MRNKFRYVILGICLSLPAFAQGQGTSYRRQDVLLSRFGGEQMQDLMTRAHQFRENVAKIVVGQDRIAQILEDRLITYLDAFSTQQGGLFSLHLLGLPGIGKSALLQQLSQLGIKIIRVDAQKFTGLGVEQQISELLSTLFHEVSSQGTVDKPLILLIDELDKIPEITPDSANGPETTQPLIGLLNEALTDGRITLSTSHIDLTRTLIVTSMNLSPQFLDTFVKERFGNGKDFYRMSIDDLKSFHAWISEDPSARYRILSRLFRTNTVGRIAPNAELLEPLGEAEYRLIIHQILSTTLQPLTTDSANARRIEFGFSDNLVDFFFSRAVFAPSGARETVLRVGPMLEQLKGIATRINIGEMNSMGQPRQAFFEADPNSENKVRITITPLARRGRNLIEKEPQQFSVEYSPLSRNFIRPPGLIMAPSQVRFAGISSASSERREAPLTHREIRNARFSEEQRRAVGLAGRVDQDLIGQTQITVQVEAQVRAFLGRPLPILTNPSMLVLAGFPGFGKSLLTSLTGLHSGLPSVNLSLQGFSASTPDSVNAFLAALESAIYDSKPKQVNGRFLLVLEELDKLFEIDPNTGAIVNRPVMGPIKELFDKGFIDQVVTASNGSRHHYKIDIRNAFTMVTMNFATSLFDFRSDPKVTSFEDMIKAWHSISHNQEALRATLARIFSVETVNRLLPRFHIQRPLEQHHYRTIVENHLRSVLQARFNLSGRNSAQIFITPTDNYIEYIISEAVIPSEGPRGAVLTAQSLLSMDAERIVGKIPRSGPRSTAKLVATLDFEPATNNVVARGHFGSEKDQLFFRNTVSRRFPIQRLEGPIEEERMIIALHEFGHAYVAIRMGLRFRQAAVVSPIAGLGGYVSLADSPTRSGKSLVGQIYFMLAARAMERIIRSTEPRNESSVFDASLGGRLDYQQATKYLYDLVYELAMNPYGLSMDRNGAIAGDPYANFSAVPGVEVESLGIILRHMENYLVRDLLAANSREWYLEKIETFARNESLSEKEFYKLIGYPHPGENGFEYGADSLIRQLLPKAIKALPQETLAAAAFRQSKTETTAAQNLNAALEFLARELEQRLNIQSTNLVEIADSLARVRRCEGIMTGQALIEEY